MSTIEPCINLQDYDEDEAQRRVDELLEKYYDKHYDSFEEFQKDLFEKIEKAHNDIEAGNGIPMEEIVAEIREKYGIQCNWF